VAHYAVGAVRYLQEQGAELLVIACNTATALALDEIKAAAGVEVIGVVEPGAEAAAAASRKRKVVVIGTEATISSHAYRRALEAEKSRCAKRLVRCLCRWSKRGGWSIR
jgi:glutamate racemase